MIVIFFILSVLAIIVVFNIFRGIANISWIRMIIAPVLTVLIGGCLGWLVGCITGEQTLLGIIGSVCGAAYFIWEVVH